MPRAGASSRCGEGSPEKGASYPRPICPRTGASASWAELPHQWVEIHARCACGEYVERHVKFSDGVAVEVRPEPPRHEPGFFDDSGGFDP